MIETVSGNGALRTIATPFSSTILPSLAETAISARAVEPTKVMNDVVASASTDLFIKHAVSPCADLCGPVLMASIQRRQRVVDLSLR